MAAEAPEGQGPKASAKQGLSVVDSIRGMMAGPIAGVCSRLVTYPADTIKARLQVQGALPGGGPAPYRGTWHAVVQVAQREGARGFYRGFGAAAVGSVPGNLAYFGAYEAARAAVPAHWGAPGDMAVGAAAQAAAGCVFTPVDLVKERLQVAPLMGATGGPAAVVRDLLRQSGPLGLLKGYWATNAVWLPWNTLFIACYEAAKRAWAQAADSGACRADAGPGGAGPGPGDQAELRRRGEPGAELSHFALGVCSAGAASLAALLTQPADVVKTRLQVLSACEGYARTTALQLARQMWAAEGPRVFMTGLGARILQLAPGTALSWVIYEPVKRALAPPEG